MKKKTSSLTGAALDWVVAKCEGLQPNEAISGGYFKVIDGNYDYIPSFKPSSDWAQGGPIIERERITIHSFDGSIVQAVIFKRNEWGVPLLRGTEGKGVFGKYQQQASAIGIDGLEAAMRCYVASKLGDEVEVPDELCPA